MRTTIDIDDGVLAAAKELARLQHVSAGHIASKLAREALAGRRPQQLPSQRDAWPLCGFWAFPARGGFVTNTQVDDLRDQEGA